MRQISQAQVRMTFSLQALSAEFIARNRGKLEARVYRVPDEIDMKVARLKLEALGVRTDALSSDQESYLTGWKEGT